MLKALRSNLKLFWVFIRAELLPMKGRKYVEAYLELMPAIGTDKRKGRCVQQVYILLALSFLLSVVQCCHHHPLFTLITFDYMGHYNLPASIKISKAMINITVFLLLQCDVF